MPQIWASQPPPSPPKLVVKHLTPPSPTGRLNEVFSTTLSTWQEMGVLVWVAHDILLSFSFTTPLWPQILHFVPRWGSLFSRKLFSITRPYWVWPLIQQTWLEYLLWVQMGARHCRCNHDWTKPVPDLEVFTGHFWWTECNWIYEGSLLPTMWKS